MGGPPGRASGSCGPLCRGFEVRAEHADRYAKLESGEPLTPGDLQFRYWSHMQLMLHAESLQLRHPDGGRGMKFTAKCPF